MTVFLTIIVTLVVFINKVHYFYLHVLYPHFAKILYEIFWNYLFLEFYVHITGLIVILYILRKKGIKTFVFILKFLCFIIQEILFRKLFSYYSGQMCSVVNFRKLKVCGFYGEFFEEFLFDFLKLTKYLTWTDCIKIVL